MAKLEDIFENVSETKKLVPLGNEAIARGIVEAGVAEDLTPFIEICSVHGHFEWFARKAMEKGLKIGFIGGSDDHTCRPGGSCPTSMVEAVNGGLMGEKGTLGHDR